MEKLILNSNFSEKSSYFTDSSSILSFNRHKKSFLSTCPSPLLSSPRLRQASRAKTTPEDFLKEKSMISLLPILNFLKDSEKSTKRRLALIQISIQESISTYSQKIVELPANTHKKTLILDLNETLVHCSSINQSRKDHFSFKIRPHVYELLEFASKRFEVIVFTSAKKSCAERVIDVLDPCNSIFSMRLYGDKCINTPIGLVKDLRIFKGRDLKKMILVDNSLMSFAYQLQNGVPILGWYGDPNDQELVKLIEFLKVVDQVSDVRIAIQAVFQLSYSRGYDKLL